MQRLKWDGPKPVRIAGKITKGYSRPHPQAGRNDGQP
jgi:hypothetical protein